MKMPETTRNATNDNPDEFLYVLVHNVREVAKEHPDYVYADLGVCCRRGRQGPGGVGMTARAWAAAAAKIGVSIALWLLAVKQWAPDDTVGPAVIVAGSVAVLFVTLFVAARVMERNGNGDI